MAKLACGPPNMVTMPGSKFLHTFRFLAAIVEFRVTQVDPTIWG